MARNEWMSAPVLAAIVVGGSVLAGSWMVKSSLQQTSSQLEEIKTSLEQTKSALVEVAKAQPASAPPKRRGPDPNKRYAIKNNGSPAKGPLTAKVKIYEFSDFQ